MTLSSSAKALCCLHRSDLKKVFRSAAPAQLATITGFRYRGLSLTLPAIAELACWKKFAKIFWRSEAGVVRGHNLRMEQDDLQEPWTPLVRNGEAVTFGPYQVTKLPGTEHIEIDYGLGTRGLSPLRLVREPVRALDENSDLLLGVSLVDIGLARRIVTPSWFLLERDQAL